MGRQRWRKLLFSLALQMWLPYPLLHCCTVQFLSFFVLNILQYSDAQYQFDLETFHGNHHHVCTQAVMHTNCSPSCKTSVRTNVSQDLFKVSKLLWRNYTSLKCTNLFFIYEDFRTKSSTMLEPLHAAVGHHQSRARCSNYYQLS